MAQRFTGLLRESRGAPGVSPSTKARLPKIGGRVSRGGPSPKLGHYLDADTVALYRFDELFPTSNPADETGNYPLTQKGSPGALAGQIDNARILGGNTPYPHQFFVRNGDAALGLVFNDSWSIEAWVYVETGNVGGKILTYVGADPENVDADLHLVDLYVDPPGGSFPGHLVCRHWFNKTQYNVGHTAGAGGTQFFTTNTWYHVALTRYSPGGYHYFNLYLNGVNYTQWYGNQLDFSVPGDASHFLRVGAGFEAAELGPSTPGMALFGGQFDDMRISKVVRTTGEIEMSYNRGLGG